MIKLWKCYSGQICYLHFRLRKSFLHFSLEHLSSLLSITSRTPICSTTSKMISVVLHVWSHGKDVPCFFPLSAFLSRFSFVCIGLWKSLKTLKFQRITVKSKAPGYSPRALRLVAGGGLEPPTSGL